MLMNWARCQGNLPTYKNAGKRVCENHGTGFPRTEGRKVCRCPRFSFFLSIHTWILAPMLDGKKYAANMLYGVVRIDVCLKRKCTPTRAAITSDGILRAAEASESRYIRSTSISPCLMCIRPSDKKSRNSCGENGRGAAGQAIQTTPWMSLVRCN